MADKSAKKVAATEECERRRAEAESSKRRREESKVQAEVEKVRRRDERAAKKASTHSGLLLHVLLRDNDFTTGSEILHLIRSQSVCYNFVPSVLLCGGRI